MVDRYLEQRKMITNFFLCDEVSAQVKDTRKDLSKGTGKHTGVNTQ